MLFRKNKFNKIKRTEVVDKIIAFEKEREEIETSFLSQEKEIQSMYKKGYQEKNPQMRSFYANKIKRLKETNNNIIKRMQYLNYNISVMEKLKDAIDDQAFMKKNSEDTLVKLLGDAKSLTEFLSKSVTARKTAEDNLVGAHQVFTEMDQLYDKNEEIYGATEAEEDILAQFERGAMLDQELDSEFEDNEYIDKEKV